MPRAARRAPPLGTSCLGRRETARVDPQVRKPGHRGSVSSSAARMTAGRSRRVDTPRRSDAALPHCARPASSSLLIASRLAASAATLARHGHRSRRPRGSPRRQGRRSKARSASSPTPVTDDDGGTVHARRARRRALRRPGRRRRLRRRRASTLTRRPPTRPPTVTMRCVSARSPKRSSCRRRRSTRRSPARPRTA